jgi:hypothetical protein
MKYRFKPTHSPIFDFTAPGRLPQHPGPNVVRAYIHHVFMTKYDVDPSSAETAASQWHLGRAQDLQQSSARGLAKLLGSGVGPAVFSSVREDIWKDWWNSFHGLLGSGAKTVNNTMLWLH